MKLEFSRHIFEKKIQMPNFMKIRQVTAQMCPALTNRHTDMKKLTVAVRNFAKAPKTLTEALGLSALTSLCNAGCKVSLREIGIQFYEIYVLKGL